MTESPRRSTRHSSRSQTGPAFSRTILAAIAGGAAIILVAAAVIFLTGSNAEAGFEPVDSLEHEYSPNHLHGIGFDPDNDRLYLASHFGLFALEDGQLHQVGDQRSDLMGFTMNPNDRSEIFVSGHPQGGGNLGVLHSSDEGLNFEQIFTGIDDEVVDFHSMTVSAADSDRFYGAFMGQIYRSEDGGHNFEAFPAAELGETGLCWGVACLAAGSGDPDTVYAGTPSGLMVSSDGAESWQILNDELGQVAAVTVDPSDPERIIAYTEALGLAISNDSGETWESHQGNMPVTEGGLAFAIALDPEDRNRIFVATMNNEVFETRDMGESWERII
jgi:photosystem II stability/assembly factor-like uncharacterized protein